MQRYINELRNFPVFSIDPDRGSQQLLANAVGTLNIPTTASGLRAKYVYICVYGGTTSNRIEFTPGGTSGAAGETYVLTPLRDCAVTLNVTGYSQISWREVGDGTSNFTVYPLSDD